MSVPNFNSFQEQQDYLASLSNEEIKKQVKEEEELQELDPVDKQYTSNKMMLNIELSQRPEESEIIEEEMIEEEMIEEEMIEEELDDTDRY
jgi:hypothetical protein